MTDNATMPKVGDRIKLTQEIYDDGDGHHPSGNIGWPGEDVIVRSVGKKGEKWLGVSHPTVTDGREFTIYPGEWRTI